MASRKSARKAVRKARFVQLTGIDRLPEPGSWNNRSLYSMLQFSGRGGLRKGYLLPGHRAASKLNLAGNLRRLAATQDPNAPRVRFQHTREENLREARKTVEAARRLRLTDGLTNRLPGPMPASATARGVSTFIRPGRFAALAVAASAGMAAMSLMGRSNSAYAATALNAGASNKRRASAGATTLVRGHYARGPNGTVSWVNTHYRKNS